VDVLFRKKWNNHGFFPR